MQTETKKFTVQITGMTGYFEHKHYGDEYAGGLWFNPLNQLVDFDGVAEVPAEVIQALQAAGYNMDYAI